MTLDIANDRSGAEPRKRLSWTRKRQLLGISSILVGLLAWWAATSAGVVNKMLLPSPGEVLAAAIDMIRDGSLALDIGISLTRAIAGFVLAALIAIPIGLAIGRSRVAEAIIDPWIEVLRPVPPIAFLPLVVLWFGIGETSKLVVICYGAMFPILLNTVHGARHVDETLLRAARVLGAGKQQMFRLVILPAALPNILTGLRLGAGMAIFVLVAAELLGSESGLGYLITDSREHFFTDRVMVGIFALGTIGFALNRGLLWSEKHLLRWRAPQD